MAVDPKANAAYVADKAVRFAPGQMVFVLGIEFTVVSVSSGSLILAPVNVKT